jgi:hypothetical protein
MIEAAGVRRLRLVYPENVKVHFGILLTCALALSTWAQGPNSRLPRFEDYPVKEVLKAKPVPPQFITNAQLLVKEDMLFLFTAMQRPNFAGRFVAVSWPCGTECTKMAIVDGKTGTIYPPPLNNSSWAFGLPIAQQYYANPDYRADSRLFILKHGCPEGPESPCNDYYFVWENNDFKLVRMVPFTIPGQVAPVVPAKSSLAGTWEGSWSYSNGRETSTHRFRLTFADRSGRLTGAYVEVDGNPKQSHRVQKLVPTSFDNSTYRMEVQGDCWNIQIEGNAMSGMLNGGKCSAIGIGSGARLIELEAKKIGKVVR